MKDLARVQTLRPKHVMVVHHVHVTRVITLDKLAHLFCNRYDLPTWAFSE